MSQFQCIKLVGALPTRYYEYFDKNVLIILHLIEYTKLYKIDYLCSLPISTRLLAYLDVKIEQLIN